MHPPAPSMAYREVPSGGDTLSGIFVPEKTWVGYNWMGVFLDPKLWGADANTFGPDRWFIHDATRLKQDGIEH